MEQGITSVNVDHSKEHSSDLKDPLLIKRNQLQEDLERLEQSILCLKERYDRDTKDLIARKKKVEGTIFHIDALLDLTSNQNPQSNTTGVRVPEEISINEAAFIILNDQHKPIHYKELARLIQERNIGIPGKDASATLLSRITRDKRFKRGEHRGYYVLSSWRIRRTKPMPKRAKSQERKQRGSK